MELQCFCERQEEKQTLTASDILAGRLVIHSSYIIFFFNPKEVSVQGMLEVETIIMQTNAIPYVCRDGQYAAHCSCHRDAILSS